MNRVKSILAMLKRSLPLRGDESRFAPGFVIVLIVVLFSLVGHRRRGDKETIAHKNKAKKSVSGHQRARPPSR